MNKETFIKIVAKNADFTQRDAATAVDAVFESIVEALEIEPVLKIKGFGNFELRTRAARIGRNPKSGNPVDIPEHKVPYWKPSREIRELLK